MKHIVTALILLIASGSFAQMKIKEGTFENGLSYPILYDQYDSTRYAVINKDLLAGLSDLEESAYCISDYGYVHKGSHIQIQVMCTCMEMDKGELRFFFYNLDTGEPVPYSNLFELKKKDEALTYIDAKVASYISTNSNACSTSLKNSESVKFDDLNVRMTRDGLEIRSKDPVACENSPVKLSWNELKDYLKYKFI
ncbi:MAG: hypothetical protein ACO2Z9_01320 [Crocinitomicaceae bacterium]